MIIKFTALLRNSGRTLLLAGIFSAASAFATPQAATPNFSPAGGAYTSAQSVSITSATSGASVAYTTDGSIPTVSGGTITHGTLYSGAVIINGTSKLSAITFENGYLDSAVASCRYTVRPPTFRPQGVVNTPPMPILFAPTFNPPPGTFSATVSVTITTPDSGASIRYTTDGSTPTETIGNLYSGPLTINATTTLLAIAFETGATDSPVTSGTYTINIPTPTPPAGGGGAPNYGFLGFLAFAGILRWKLRKKHALT
jgi:hypothetical protein